MSNTQPVRVGEPAPDFTLPATTGGTISLADFRGKQPVVLYFYPKDDTPGCTKEACAFRDVWSEFQRKGAAILGVSTDSLKSHEKFKNKHALSFPLLSDEGAEVARRYGVWKEKSLYGRKFMGIERSTVVIGKDGRVRKLFPKVKVEGHIDEVLAAIE